MCNQVGISSAQERLAPFLFECSWRHVFQRRWAVGWNSTVPVGRPSADRARLRAYAPPNESRRTEESVASPRRYQRAAASTAPPLLWVEAILPNFGSYGLGFYSEGEFELNRRVDADSIRTWAMRSSNYPSTYLTGNGGRLESIARHQRPSVRGRGRNVVSILWRARGQPWNHRAAKIPW